jgi:hypothetical protein
VQQKVEQGKKQGGKENEKDKESSESIESEESEGSESSIVDTPVQVQCLCCKLI